MNGLQSKAEAIVDASVRDFLRAINSIVENGPFRKYRTRAAAFEVLEPANKTFYEYAFFERSLECYIRENLINQSLMELFHLFGVECLWPEKKLAIGFSNESIENIYHFEFIVVINEHRIGYRYTGLGDNEIDELIEKYNLTKICQINWGSSSRHNRSDNSKFEIRSIEKFLELYFGEIDYKTILKKYKHAVNSANDNIGFETIPRLSLRYLSIFKVAADEILHDENYRIKRFSMLPDSKTTENLEELSFSDDDYKVCDKNFIDKELYKALIGTEGFAKCFITAEYQYQVFKQGNNFDYTSVACGYLKAIEQLIYKLIMVNLEYPQKDKLWILKNGNKMPSSKYVKGDTVRPNQITGKPQVVFQKGFEDYFNITLSPMIWFIHDNINGWELSEDGREKVHKMLLCFAQDCRNDHFHKDNIDDFDVVKRIRNNTILIAYLLLGGYKHSGDIKIDHELLGVIDDSYDRLYKKVQELPRGMREFIIKFNDGRTIKAYRHFYQGETNYSLEGSVSESVIRFVEVDEFSSVNYDRLMEEVLSENEFLISRNHIPIYIAYINGRNEEVQITW